MNAFKMDIMQSTVYKGAQRMEKHVEEYSPSLMEFLQKLICGEPHKIVSLELEKIQANSRKGERFRNMS